MAVYVDKLRYYKDSSKVCGRIVKWSHLTADTAEELHRFAEFIGLKRSWFQNHRIPHYDITTSKRKEAINHGAILILGERK